MAGNHSKSLQLRLGTVSQAYNPSTLEDEAIELLQVQGQPGHRVNPASEKVLDTLKV